VLGIGEDTTATDETIADRAVTRFELPSGQIAYALPSGEIVWVFLNDEGRLEEVVRSLP
jgi:hypothetical protein